MGETSSSQHELKSTNKKSNIPEPSVIFNFQAWQLNSNFVQLN